MNEATGATGNQIVKVKVRSGQTLPFPAVCVHCAQPAGERLRLYKRRGRISRSIDLPLCADCAQEVHRFSYEEERWYKLSLVIALLIWMIGLAILLLLLPAGLPFLARLLLAALFAAGFAVAAFKLGRRVAAQKARPEKQAILNSAHLTGFSEQESTFEFSNPAFFSSFITLNEARLIHHS